MRRSKTVENIMIPREAQNLLMFTKKSAVLAVLAVIDRLAGRKYNVGRRRWCDECGDNGQ